MWTDVVMKNKQRGEEESHLQQREQHDTGKTRRDLNELCVAGAKSEIYRGLSHAALITCRRNLKNTLLRSKDFTPRAIKAP